MRRGILIAGVLGLLVATSCGSDDDGDEATDVGADATTIAEDAEDAGDDATTDDETVADDEAEAGAEGDETGDGGGDDGGGGDGGGGDDGDGAAAGSAVVTVDGETYTFDQEVVCIALGGAVGGSFFSTADDISFDVDLPPTDWETRPADEGWGAPSVRLDDERDDLYVSWRAGGEVVENSPGVPPEVEVTSYEIDGASGSGEATVVEINRLGIDDPVVAQMTFEFTCS
jgi:hypothetical protein